jgi:Ca-activated chloride channel family protein
VFTFAELMGNDLALLRKGQAIFDYAEGLKAYQMDPTVGSLETAFASLAAAEALNANDSDLAQIRSILEGI